MSQWKRQHCILVVLGQHFQLHGICIATRRIVHVRVSRSCSCFKDHIRSLTCLSHLNCVFFAKTKYFFYSGKFDEEHFFENKVSFFEKASLTESEGGNMMVVAGSCSCLCFTQRLSPQNVIEV